MEDYDWTQFSIDFYFETDVQRVFKYFATAQGLESFFIKNAQFSNGNQIRKKHEYFCKDDVYVWQWRHNLEIEGKVLDVVENQFVKFSFGNMEVKITFQPTVKNTVLVHLVQYNIPKTEDGMVMGHLNCRCCWIFFLTNLKSIIKQDVDLRDTDAETVSSMEIGYIAKEL